MAKYVNRIHTPPHAVIEQRNILQCFFRHYWNNPNTTGSTASTIPALAQTDAQLQQEWHQHNGYLLKEIFVGLQKECSFYHQF